MTTTTGTTSFSPTADQQTPATTRRASVGEFKEGLRWAQSVLDDPVTTSVQASGMSQVDLHAIEQAAGGNA